MTDKIKGGNMKQTIMFLILFSLPLFSQTYMNINFNDATMKSGEISTIKKMTFSADGTIFNCFLTDGAIIEETLSEISNITFDETGGGDPLPVELVEFYADVIENGVFLHWSTATEVNNYGFEVEREIKNRSNHNSICNDYWQQVGFVKGFGNSNSPKNYTFVDSETIPAQNRRYRLKQIDFDGAFQYSETLTVEFDESENFELLPNYPNPFNPLTTIEFQIPIASNQTKVTTKLVVYDILGRKVKTLLNRVLKPGIHTIKFNAENFPSGVYYCRINFGNIFKTIKMTLIK